jgi:murein L,D-transpeptidase YcbB/YkuD
MRATVIKYFCGFSLNKIACAILCMLCFACTPASAPAPTLDRAQSDTDALSTALADYMGCFHLELMGLEKQQLVVTSKIFCLTEVYAEENPQPYWVSPAGPGPKARTVLDFLKTAEEDGLDPENYETEEISALFRARTAQNLALLDTLLTYNLIKYIHDVHHGRIKQPHADVRQFPQAMSIEFKPREAFVKAMAAPDLSVYLEGLPPAHEHYAGLKKILALYREIQKKGGWPVVPLGTTIRPGDDDERIPAIIKRLAVTGDLDPDMDHEDPPSQYSAQLVPSVARFQGRHGLAPDGVIGEQTIAAMNVSVDERVRQIIINMTRWRWQDHVLGEKYILINIAGFNLSAFEAGREAFSFPVIVGKLKQQTPVFSDRISSIEINPYWNIPNNIARDEELPNLRKDPQSLQKRSIRLFQGWSEDAPEIDSTSIDWHTVSPAMMNRYRMRQDPGPRNALGRIKFVFPNTYSVYLHDTPAQGLFARNMRDFSHGCIRVSDPVRLAAFALAGEDDRWTPETIKNAIDAQKRVVIRLAEPLPVHITYQTAWIDKDGIVCFNNDVYGRDKRLLSALFNEEENTATVDSAQTKQ